MQTRVPVWRSEENVLPCKFLELDLDIFRGLGGRYLCLRGILALKPYFSSCV